MRWRGVWICLSVFCVTAVIAAPLVKTLLWQWGEILPPLGAYLWRDPYVAAGHEVQRDRSIMAVRSALQQAADRPEVPFDLRAHVSADPGNGLYACVELLGLLRGSGDEDAIARAVRSVARAGSVRLYLMRQYALAEATFRAGGVSPRRAARAAHRVRFWIEPLHEAQDPILRELVDRLSTQADRWRRGGRIADAKAADALAIRLLTDVASESGMPDVVLLAADLLPRALEGLAADVAAAAAMPDAPDFEADCRSVAARLVAWRSAWRQRVRTDGINVLPYTGVSLHTLLVPDAHARALRSACVATLLLVAVATLAAAEVFLLVIAGVTWRRDATALRWRQTGRGMVLAAVLVAGSLLLVTWVALPMRSAAYAWLISLPSLRAVAAIPVFVLVLTGLAGRWGIEWLGEAEERPSRAGAYAVAGGLLAIIVVGTTVFARQPHDWQVPPGIRALRDTAVLLGVVSTFVLVVWAGAKLVRRVGGQGSVGLSARAWLHVTSPALMAVGLVALAALALNRHRDEVHEAGFARAAADPVAACVGTTAGLETPPASLLDEARRLAETAAFRIRPAARPSGTVVGDRAARYTEQPVRRKKRIDDRNAPGTGKHPCPVVYAWISSRTSCSPCSGTTTWARFSGSTSSSRVRAARRKSSSPRIRADSF